MQETIRKMQDKAIRLFPSGIVTPPASKSISHRAVICAALAHGESVIDNVTLSDDIRATLEGVGALGAEWRLEGRTLYVRGGAGRRADLINCVESGSTLRFLIPVAALSDRETVFRGKGRLLVRPMGAYDTVFAGTDVRFSHSQREIRVCGPLRSGLYMLPGDVSSQFVSGLLFALPLADGDSEIHLSSPLESRQYADMTVDVLRSFGIEAEASEYVFRVRGGQRYRPSRYTVETDYSQAAYFLGAAALGLDVGCAGLSPESMQGDKAFLRVLERMGAEVVWDGGLVSVRAGRLSAITADARENPDLIPPIAALCCFCEGTSRIVNAGRLRLKESDRLRALAEELGRLGARVAESPDSLTIVGAPTLRGGRVDAHHDHRIAMSMALAAVRCEGDVRLVGWHNVSKSYPGFWDDFEKKPLPAAPAPGKDAAGAGAATARKGRGE
ncbi:MAG: 3-phosphoshikimate 1-carboxyvinyltransferase [Clostridiales Family XIII bacterium]|jgi:3-phosphoshikimate 1-carboxyvinyltransferase|nr:3-phosphoshikimate 1-carboxyvinyltransferase [Clostridiales Family XIII bacterium]